MQKLLIAIKCETICAAIFDMFGDLDIHICHNGKAALDLIDNLRPDILVINLSLPGMDGPAVLHQTNHKPHSVIAFTSITTNSVLEEAYDAGVTELIAIPCTLDLIVDRIQSCLQKIPSPGH